MGVIFSGFNEKMTLVEEFNQEKMPSVVKFAMWQNVLATVIV